MPPVSSAFAGRHRDWSAPAGQCPRPYGGVDALSPRRREGLSGHQPSMNAYTPILLASHGAPRCPRCCPGLSHTSWAVTVVVFPLQSSLPRVRVRVVTPRGSSLTNDVGGRLLHERHAVCRSTRSSRERSASWTGRALHRTRGLGPAGKSSPGNRRAGRGSLRVHLGGPRSRHRRLQRPADRQRDGSDPGRCRGLRRTVLRIVPGFTVPGLAGPGGAAAASACRAIWPK